MHTNNYLEKQLKGKIFAPVPPSSSASTSSATTKDLRSFFKNFGPLIAMAIAPMGAVTKMTRTAIVTICIPTSSWNLPE